MESLGSLIDRLTITNLKLWHVQAWIDGVKEQTAEQFCAHPPSYVQEKIRQLDLLNKQRNALISEINVKTGDPVGEVVKV